MNDKRRKKLMEAKDMLSAASRRIDEMLDQERDYLDNIPENLASGDRYERAEHSAEKLEDALSAIGEAQDAIIEACE